MGPMLELEVIGANKAIKINALVDTGFTGYACVPVKLAKDLGLELCGEEEYELANGHWVNQLLFKGRLKFLGKTQKAQISLTNSETAQIGVLLLADCQLSIDFVSNKVKVSRKAL